MEDRQKVNVLIVDDDPTNLLVLESVLGRLGQNLVMARSGEEALRHLEAGGYAVILLDVHMPVLDGFQTAARIRQQERSRHTPIIFVTAVGRGGPEVSRAYALGAVDYIFKPIVPEILLAKVSVFVDLYQTHRAELRRREREQQSLRRLSSSPSGPVAPSAGRKPLRESAPEVFREMVKRYGRLVERAVEQQAYRVEHDFSGELVEMASQLGSLRVGPRDIVDMHLRAIEGQIRGVPPARAQCCMLEARLLALELMGHLVDHYRRAIPEPGRTRDAEASAACTS